MKVKFFYKKDCPKCPAAKEVMAQVSHPVEAYSLDEVDGLAEAAYHNVMSTPTVLILNEQEQEIASFRGEVPSKQELEKWLAN